MGLSAGARLGPYEIIDAIGAGGMGEVYRARDTRLHRIVAVKLIGGTADDTARARLFQEARSAAALNHPHICTVHEIDEVDNRLFIVMEFVDGPSLSSLVAQGVAAATAAQYGVQIADALAHAHDRGVIHRDLKSANLMVASDGRVKVLDFGIATLTGDAALLAATRVATTPGMVAGTTAYMAPEILKGGAADRRSDIWALGVVLYEMAAGNRPFEGETAFEITSAILRDEPKALPRTVPVPLRTVIARCLAKDPSRRYQQASEVRSALEATTTRSARATRVKSDAPKAARPRPERPARPRGGARARIRSLAVLPLDNVSRDPQQDYFVDGMTEELIAAVARIDGLRVISRMSIMRFKQTSKTAPEIARELNVDALLAGSVRRSDDRVRIFVQLINPSNDSYVWTSNFDNDLRDIQTLESTIAQGVADELSLTVRPSQRPDGGRPPATDPEAYSWYLRGRHARNQAALPKAIECFERAIERDPSHAPAHAGIADACFLRGLFESLSPQEAYEKGFPAARRALELDPSLSDAHTAVANFKFFYEWDWAGAKHDYERAIELAPNASRPRWLQAQCLANLGWIDEGVKACGAARDLDPLWVAPYQSLAYYSLLSGRRAEAAEHNRVALAVDPHYPLAWITDGASHLLSGRHEAAIASFDRASSLAGRTSFFVAWLGMACAMAGDRQRAAAIARDLETASRTSYISRGALCWVYGALGDLEAATRCLRLAHQQRDAMLVCVPTFFGWDPIRDTDDFREIVGRLDFPALPREPSTLRSVEPVTSTTEVAAVATKSVIVLPFANASPEAEDAYFSDGLTDGLITDLSRVAGLRVVSSSATFRLKGTQKDLATIAREFRVSYVVEGRVRKDRQSVRITAQLLEIAEDRTIWADKYVGELSEVFALQERVSRSIAEALQLRLKAPSRAPKPEAAAAFLKGRHCARQATSAGLQKALESFSLATTLDPNDAPAFAALADTYIALTTAWDALPALETMPRARAAAERALQLDAMLAEAHVALGLVAMYSDWDRERAEREFGEALRLSPYCAEAHQYFSALLIWLDTRYAEALDHIQRAAVLDPADPRIAVDTLWVRYFSRQFDRAVDQGRKVVASEPLYGFGHYSLGCALMTSGNLDEAIECFTRGIELDGRGSHHIALLGMAHALAGRHDRALQHLAELDALDRAGRDVATWKLHVYAGLADANGVLECLKVAIDRRNSSTIFLLTHPFIDFVRRDPRFVALLQDAGVGYLATRTWTPEWRPPAAART